MTLEQREYADQLWNAFIEQLNTATGYENVSFLGSADWYKRHFKVAAETLAQEKNDGTEVN